jgi:hypothetical protein
MVTYIYFVKCPNCDDEHFDFFDEAKEFALGCLSQKPVITQTEVCRNDFGECTDSADLGTVWSWEDAMKDTESGCTDTEPTKSIFTKDDLKYNDYDPEFDDLDNSLELDIRKPVPEDMSIEDLVEAMEENEDEVECALCNELFPKADCYYDEDEGYICTQCKEDTVKCEWCGFRYDPSELRKEVNLGWLCSRCEMAIKSRGETLTFREGSYWDLLDENHKPITWICEFDGKEIGTVDAVTEEEAYEAMENKYPDLNYSLHDGVAVVYPADKSELTEFLEDVKELHDLGNTYDGGYPADGNLETLEEPDTYGERLADCPECGATKSFDHETGICIGCGFSL